MLFAVVVAFVPLPVAVWGEGRYYRGLFRAGCMIRVGFDMDGVLADFAAAFRDVEARLFGRPAVPAEQPEREEAGAAAAEEPPRAPREGLDPRELRRRREAIWNDIRATSDFWTTLQATQDGIVSRIHRLALQYRWEVFFITQRPSTDGETVQRQTQRWLVEQGFDLPSVLVIPGSRGAAAAALKLDYHADDSTQNCLDVMADSGARVILVTSDATPPLGDSARKLGIAVVRDISACVDILEQASIAQSNPTLLQRLATMVGWR